METTIFSDLFLPLTLVLITLGLGLSISLDDIWNIVRKPRNIIIGLLSQLIILPLIAFGIATITKMDPLLAVGLVLIAVCPGGATSNLVTFMLNGNVALSVSMTAINGLITIYTIPMLTKLALRIFIGVESEIELSVLKTVLNIFTITVIPASIGVLIKAKWPVFAKRVEVPLRYLLPGLLFLVYAGVLFLERGVESTPGTDFLRILPFAITLNIMAISAGYFVPGMFRINKRNRYTIAIEVGLQNSTLALFIAGSILSNHTIGMVPLVYGSFSFFTTWGLGYLAKKYF